MKPKIFIGMGGEAVTDLFLNTSSFYCSCDTPNGCGNDPELYHFSDIDCRDLEEFFRHPVVCVLVVGGEVAEVVEHIPGKCGHQGGLS